MMPVTSALVASAAGDGASASESLADFAHRHELLLMSGIMSLMIVAYVGYRKEETAGVAKRSVPQAGEQLVAEGAAVSDGPSASHMPVPKAGAQQPEEKASLVNSGEIC